MGTLNVFLFKSIYGGDAYEKSLSDHLKYYFPHKIRVFEYKRLGSWRTAFELIKMSIRFYTSSGPSIRPFGTCLFKRNTVIVFHHFDLTYTPWYSKFLEFLDLQLIRILFPILNFKIIVVSRYWYDFLHEIDKDRKFIIYNDITYEEPRYDRASIAQKYNLEGSKKWILFGGSSEKKGGLSAIENMSPGFYEQFEVICTGSTPSNSHSRTKYVWISADDWWSFLSHLSVGVFLSKFKEGWCRMAHECILAGVVVLGSGSGGMGELLELFSQRKITDISHLEEEIKKASDKPVSNDATEKQKYLASVSKNNLDSLIASLKS
jgi:hypothetical protein